MTIFFFSEAATEEEAGGGGDMLAFKLRRMDETECFVFVWLVVVTVPGAPLTAFSLSRNREVELAKDFGLKDVLSFLSLSAAGCGCFVLSLVVGCRSACRKACMVSLFDVDVSVSVAGNVLVVETLYPSSDAFRFPPPGVLWLCFV